MRKTYRALRLRTRNMLLQDWATDAPTPSYYDYLPSPSPHPFIGLRKFVAGRIHQMRAAKSDLAAHRSWLTKAQTQPAPDAELNLSPFGMPSSLALPDQRPGTSC